MILDSLDQFPNLLSVPLVIDVETTSFDDETEAFNVFNGHRICGYAFGLLDGEENYYLPIRHSNGKNCAIEPALKYMRELIKSCPLIVGHNIKFDAKFWRVGDNCTDQGNLVDTMILARIFHNDIYSGYSLDNLGKMFLKETKIDAVKIWCATHKTKDYGACPIEIMGPYAEKDIELTRKLYHLLMKKIPTESKDIAKTDNKLNRILLKQEIRGVRIDFKVLQDVANQTSTEMIELSEKIDNAAGYSLDPSKPGDREHLMERLGCICPSFTLKTHKPQWNNENLILSDNPIAKDMAEYLTKAHFYGLFCEGITNRITKDGRLHCDFGPANTQTGRLSCRNPNLQNLNPAAQNFILADKNEILLMFDYSQIEYRIFGHYSQDERILKAYNEDIFADFHQLLADMLGIPRDPAKTINFGLLYGMGKRKLLRALRELLAKVTDTKMIAKLKKIVYWEGELDTITLERLATTIYKDYHRQFPSIRELQGRAKRKIAVSGTLRNYMGRIYRFGSNGEGSHKGLNYLCQGTAADIFKNRLVALHEHFPELKLITNIHDSGLWTMPKEWVIENFDKIKEILEDFQPALRVPLRVEGKVGNKRMGSLVECNSSKEIDSALEKEKCLVKNV